MRRLGWRRGVEKGLGVGLKKYLGTGLTVGNVRVGCRPFERGEGEWGDGGRRGKKAACKKVLKTGCAEEKK
jgi:hypothetical protein